MTPNIQAWVEATIQRVTLEQFQHMSGAGVGRYKQYIESEPTQIDGYDCSFSVDEFLGPAGVGCIFNFFVRKDGQTFVMRDGHGPGYSEGADQEWTENKPENPGLLP